MNRPSQPAPKQNISLAQPVYEESPQTRKRMRRELLFLKLRLAGAWICISVLNVRLAESHRVHAFHYFRKHSQAYPVFIFGILFWASLLALPLAAFPYKKTTYKHRYIIAALLIMILMNALYLFAFAGYALFAK